MPRSYRGVYTGTLYLNNDGSRWIHLTNGQKDRVTVQLPDGTYVKRTVLYYESFGNFAVACISYKGEKSKHLFEMLDNGESGIKLKEE